MKQNYRKCCCVLCRFAGRKCWWKKQQKTGFPVSLDPHQSAFRTNRSSELCLLTSAQHSTQFYPLPSKETLLKGGKDTHPTVPFRFLGLTKSRTYTSLPLLKSKEKEGNLPRLTPRARLSQRSNKEHPD